MRILVVEDDPVLAKLIRLLLVEEGYSPDYAGTAADGLMLALVHPYDAVILDLGLPDRSGLEVLQELRRRNRTMPVLVLTGQRDQGMEVRVLDAGADDYVGKPFGAEELKARLRALVRRGGARRTEQVVFGDLHLNRVTRQLLKDAVALRFSATEFRLLEYFLLRPNEVVTRSELLDKLWDMNFDPNSNVVDVNVGRVRRKLAAVKSTVDLRAVRGVGFQLVLRNALSAEDEGQAD